MTFRDQTSCFFGAGGFGGMALLEQNPDRPRKRSLRRQQKVWPIRNIPKVFILVKALGLALFQFVSALRAPNVSAPKAPAEKDIRVIGVVITVAHLVGSALGARTHEDGVGKILRGIMLAGQLLQSVKHPWGNLLCHFGNFVQCFGIDVFMLRLVSLAAATNLRAFLDRITAVPAVHPKNLPRMIRELKQILPLGLSKGILVRVGDR